MRLYRSLRATSATKENSSPSGPFLAHEGPVLTGYTCGNSPQDGCLTNDLTVRFHSCIRQIDCPALRNKDKVVWIRPIVTRLQDGTEIAEVGIGGGGEDLTREPELVLDNESVLQIIGEWVIDAPACRCMTDLHLGFNFTRVQVVMILPLDSSAESNLWVEPCR